MGWAGGSDVMSGIVKAMDSISSRSEDGEEEIAFYEGVIAILDKHDWDTHDEVVGLDSDLDAALRNTGHLEESEDLDEALEKLANAEKEVERLEAECKKSDKEISRLRQLNNGHAEKVASIRRDMAADRVAYAESGKENEVLKFLLGIEGRKLDQKCLSEMQKDAITFRGWLRVFANRLGLSMTEKEWVTSSIYDIIRHVDAQLVQRLEKASLDKQALVENGLHTAIEEG